MEVPVIIRATLIIEDVDHASEALASSLDSLSAYLKISPQKEGCLDFNTARNLRWDIMTNRTKTIH